MKFSEKLLFGLIAAAISYVLVGICIWIFYPLISEVLPKLVETGYIPDKLTWLQSFAMGLILVTIKYALRNPYTDY